MWLAGQWRKYTEEEGWFWNCITDTAGITPIFFQLLSAWNSNVMAGVVAATLQCWRGQLSRAVESSMFATVNFVYSEKKQTPPCLSHYSQVMRCSQQWGPQLTVILKLVLILCPLFSFPSFLLHFQFICFLSQLFILILFPSRVSAWLYFIYGFFFFPPLLFLPGVLLRPVYLLYDEMWFSPEKKVMWLWCHCGYSYLHYLAHTYSHVFTFKS